MSSVPDMYASIGTLAGAGWVAAAVALAVLGLRAVWVERRAVAAATEQGGRPAGRGRRSRVGGVVVDLAAAAAVLALLAVLVRVVLDGLGR